MTWLLPDQSLTSVTDEIERQSDRGAGIIAGAFVEDFLKDALRSRLRLTEAHEEKTFSDLFGRTRPLSSFSAKIDLGFLLGIYRAEIHQDLHRIRRIRNEFSHEREPLDFSRQKIVDHCRALWLPDNLFIVVSGGGVGSTSCPTDPRGRFIHTIKLMISVLHRATTNPQRPPDPLWG
jgi:hypothetical protein